MESRMSGQEWKTRVGTVEAEVVKRLEVKRNLLTDNLKETFKLW